VGVTSQFGAESGEKPATKSSKVIELGSRQISVSACPSARRDATSLRPRRWQALRGGRSGGVGKYAALRRVVAEVEVGVRVVVTCSRNPLAKLSVPRRSAALHDARGLRHKSGRGGPSMRHGCGVNSTLP